MMHRISFSVVVALLSFFLVAAAGEDLPDLDKIAERHRALLESIQSGRITYVREETLGTDDIEEFKERYRKDVEEKLRQAKAAGAGESYIRSLQEQAEDCADEAAALLASGTVHQRVRWVFDKKTIAAKETVTDLRDVAGLMSRYGAPGEVQTYDQTRSRSIANGSRKILVGRPPRLHINLWTQGDLFSIEPLWYSGYLAESVPTAGDGKYVQSVQMRRDTDNPNLIIHEVVFMPKTSDHVFVEGRGIWIPRDEPLKARRVRVLDESNDYRVTSIALFHDDRLVDEYSFEYSSDDPLSLVKMVSITSYGDDGSVMATQTLRMESVELNVEIAAAEFEIDVPPGTTIYDQTGEELIVIKPDELHEIAEELEDAESTPAEIEEIPAEQVEAPDPVETLEEPPAIEEEPAPQDDGPVPIITMGIALVIIAIIIVAVWARQRQRS